MRKINIILSNASIKVGNRGCVALSIASLSILKKLFKENEIETVIFLPDSGMQTDGNQYYRVNGMEDLNYVSCKNSPCTIKGFIKCLCNPKSLFKIIVFICKCDYVLDIGQGDSFSDIYGVRRFMTINRFSSFARLLHKPYCLLPQTIGPFYNKNVRRKAVKSIENAALVMTRDEQSFDYVKKIAPKQINVRHYIDVAFILPYKKEEFDTRYIHVGLNISSLLWYGGYKKNNQFGLEVDYPSLVRSIINQFLSEDRVILHLVPHVVESERTLENDYAISYDIQKEYNDSRIVLAPFFLGPCEAKGYISGLEFFMGARMHATIAAFSSYVPVVPMAYSRKFNGLFGDTLDYQYVVDMKCMDNDTILSFIKKAYDNRFSLKTVINDRMNSIVKEREIMLYSDLKKFFGI